MKRIAKALFVLPTLLLSSCNFKFVYRIVGYDGGGVQEGDIWEDDSGIDDSGTYNIKIWVDEKIEELTRMQKDGIIECRKSHFRLIKAEHVM